MKGRTCRAGHLQAVQRIKAWLEVSIRAHQAVGVETGLSTDKYRRLVLAAKALRCPGSWTRPNGAGLLDNSGAALRLMGRKQDGVITLDPDALPQIVAAVQEIRTE